MNKVAYTYCLVKYVHDPAVGEMLNIGVLLHAPAVNFVAGKFERHYERLSKTFARFNSDHYRFVIRQLESVCHEMSFGLQDKTLFPKHPSFANVTELTRLIMPEQGLSIQFSEAFSGITSNPEREIERIFFHAVTSQYAHNRKERRSDEEIWSVYNRELAQRKVNKYLHEKRFVTEDYNLKFDHAFKNEKWHVLMPVTLDYLKAQSLQEKATRILGQTDLLSEQKDLKKLYLLLGKPELETHREAYIRAKNLLNRIRVPKEIIEEEEADDFANELADYMKQHGVIKEGEQQFKEDKQKVA